MFVNPPGGGGVSSDSGDLRIFFKSSGDLRGNPFEKGFSKKPDILASKGEP